MFDLWESMRATNVVLASGIINPLLRFMDAQTSKERLLVDGISQYLEYRQDDVGQALVSLHHILKASTRLTTLVCLRL